MKRYLIMALAVGAALFASAENEYGIPEKIQDGNILHCFNWRMTDVKLALPEIAKAGFGAVQLSPVQGNCNVGAEWFYAYVPYDYSIVGTGVGNKAGLSSLCSEAEKYGIKIIMDVVANHINATASHRNPTWNNTEYWHSAKFKSINYNDRHSITHDNLGDYPDMNSEHEVVRQAVAAYIQELKKYGVKGIRWDAAKHISLPSEDCEFWPDVTAIDGIWHYGEILGGPGGDENALMAEYTEYMSVTDSRYSSSILNVVRAGGSTSSKGLYSTRGISADKLVYWAESHDTYANTGGETKYVAQEVIDRAWAVIACRQGATSLYLSRPAAKNSNDIKMGEKGSTNFTAPHIAAVNHLRNAMGDSPEELSSGSGVITVTRGAGGACIVVSKGGPVEVSVANGGSYVPAGEYVDEVSGNTFTVTDSTISGTVGESGIAVIYDHTAGTSAPVVSPDAPVEYYNLQGIRIAAPTAPGIYIKRQGSTATTIKLP